MQVHIRRDVPVEDQLFKVYVAITQPEIQGVLSGRPNRERDFRNLLAETVKQVNVVEFRETPNIKHPDRWFLELEREQLSQPLLYMVNQFSGGRVVRGYELWCEILKRAPMGSAGDDLCQWGSYLQLYRDTAAKSRMPYRSVWPKLLRPLIMEHGTLTEERIEVAIFAMHVVRESLDLVYRSPRLIINDNGNIV